MVVFYAPWYLLSLFVFQRAQTDNFSTLFRRSKGVDSESLVSLLSVPSLSLLLLTPPVSLFVIPQLQIPRSRIRSSRDFPLSDHPLLRRRLRRGRQQTTLREIRRQGLPYYQGFHSRSQDPSQRLYRREEARWACGLGEFDGRGQGEEDEGAEQGRSVEGGGLERVGRVFEGSESHVLYISSTQEVFGTRLVCRL